MNILYHLINVNLKTINQNVFVIVKKLRMAQNIFYIFKLF